MVQQPVGGQSDSEEDIEVDETVEPGATQHIMVGVRSGYSVYPGYLFDVPPKRIRIDHLRKQFMIHEIARARAERRFYRHGMTLMATVKEFLRLFSKHYNFQNTSNRHEEHAYVMDANSNDNYEASSDDGSDIEIMDKK